LKLRKEGKYNHVMPEDSLLKPPNQGCAGGQGASRLRLLKWPAVCVGQRAVSDPGGVEREGGQIFFA
jgi:hypothetical protein